MFFLSRLSRRARAAVGLGLLCSLVAAGCAKTQMGYNVLSFDAAIADTANQQLLLNAVRSSQHYPKSFTQPGELKAAPPVSAGLTSTLNLTRFDGLGAYSFTPNVAADAGYSEFQLKNLNFEGYMLKIRGNIDDTITNTFKRNPTWPGQLRDLLYIQKFVPSEQLVSLIDAKRKSICQRRSTDSDDRRCSALQDQIQKFADQCGDDRHFNDIAARLDRLRKDSGIYYNTASNYCHYDRFRIFLEEVSLTKMQPCSKPYRVGCLPTFYRSALDMIGYLGELIAAQNYVSKPFMPLVMVGIPVGSTFEFHDVPLFEVRIGPPGGPASVLVVHEGVPYYIPRPDFGSPNEARSMQTLDLVLQTVQAATTKDDVPKTSPSVSVVPSKKG